MVHHSLATGARSARRDNRSCRSLRNSCIPANLWVHVSKSAAATVSHARGVVKLSPGARALRQWPKSQSASPPERETLPPFPNSSICQEPAQASCAAQVTPATVSSMPAQGAKPLTGMLPTWPNRSTFTAWSVQARSI